MTTEEFELCESYEDMLSQGMEKSAIYEELDVTPQRMGKLMKEYKAESASEPEVLTGTVVNSKGVSSKIRVEPAAEYLARHEAAGTPYGRQKGEKTKLTPEELRILIKEGYSTAEVMKKHGVTEEDLRAVGMKLSKMELDPVKMLKGNM